MFVRVKTTPNSPRCSVQICENIRDGNKVKQKIVRYVGIANDEDEVVKLKNYANELIVKITLEREKSSQQLSLFETDPAQLMNNTKALGRPKQKKIEDILPPSQVTLDDIVEESRIIEGVHDAAGAMFDEMYTSLFKSKRKQDLLRDVVLARLVFPCSKRRSQQKLEKHFGKKNSLDVIYSMMDELFPKISDVKQMTFAKTKSLFPDKIDLLLFDVTTLYFESVEVDELRKFGYSKDWRFNTTQVVLALAKNQDGLPVGYELFEGNKAEVTTLIAAIESWKMLFTIDSVCFVGDRAMFTLKNMELLESKNYHYIIAAKLKKLPGALQQELFNEARYQPAVLNNEFGWIGEFNYQGRRLVVSYKSRRAMKDQHERQQVINKIKNRIGEKSNPNNLITNQGVKKFVTRDENAKIALDENKVELAAQWDGRNRFI